MHMFYKKRLADMIKVFKLHMNAACDSWIEDIAQSARGEIRIDITVEFECIYAHTINHICFG